MFTNEKFQSLPNISGSLNSEVDARKLYSLSLSNLRAVSEYTDYHHKPTPFNIRWIYGYNPKPGLINLNDQGSTIVFYAASYCGVLYNWSTNEMRILQGHRHAITCIASCERGRWLVTADSGSENCIIIWDADDYFPQKTLFNPHGPVRLARVALSADAKYLLTLAYPDSYKTALFWWIWSYGADIPDAKLEVGLPKDSVLDMKFNPFDTMQFVLLTKHDIWIGASGKVFVSERGIKRETDRHELKIRKVEKIMHTEYGRLTCFAFVENTSQILVGTTRGCVLIYGYTMEYHEDAPPGETDNLKYIKVLQMEKSRINVLRSIDGVIVTGNGAGEIHFYDDQMKLLYWIHGFKVDCVKNISFNIAPRSYQVFDPLCNKPCPCWEKVVTNVDPLTGLMKQKLLKQKLPDDATTAGKTFIIRDFVVCTNNDGVGFVDFVTEKLQIFLNAKSSQAISLTVHPEKPCVCIGYAEGFVQLYNFVQHQLFASLDLRDFYKVVVPPKEDSIKCNFEVKIPQLSATCLQYSHCGVIDGVSDAQLVSKEPCLHLACGMNNGELIFLEPTTLQNLSKAPHKDTNYEIIEICYSPDSRTIACADAGRTVCVYSYNCHRQLWLFIGKHRAHYKDISSVFFLPEKNPDGNYKLISLGSDRTMAEYDIGNSSEEYLEVFSLDRVEQTGVPLAGIEWPTPKGLDPEACRLDLPLILIATEEFKYKIINFSTTMTLSTILGPRYEHPVRWMQLITRKEDDKELQYLVFATKNVIGLQSLPLDGNPWKHTGLLAHPVQITHRCYREDLGIMFTIGARDCTMSQWAANFRAPDSTTKKSGPDLDPYYCLIENGRPGWLFQEIRDLFYYIQILCQGTFSPAIRRVKDYIPIDSLPDLMRALGYFPSEYEVENLIVEAKYKVYLKSSVTEIDFEEFVKLYLNHRPAFGVNYKTIQNAFRHFATYTNDTYQISKEDFIDLLEEHGEHFSRELSWYLLSILSGQTFEDRAAMGENDFSFLPEDITFSDFVTNLIGIHEIVDENSEQHSILSTKTSSQMTTSTIDSE